MRSSSNNHRLCRVLIPTISNVVDLHSMVQSVAVSGQSTTVLLSPPIIQDSDACGWTAIVLGPTPGSTHVQNRIDLSWNATSSYMLLAVNCDLGDVSTSKSECGTITDGLGQVRSGTLRSYLLHELPVN